MAQDEPRFTAAETAAARDAIDAAALSPQTYQALWCGGLYASMAAAQRQSSNLDGAVISEGFRNRLYRIAALDLIDKGMAQDAFSAVAESVYVVVVAQSAAANGTSPDFTLEQCAAVATAS